MSHARATTTSCAWAGYTYEWNSAQTAATRVIGGKTRQVGAQTWIYPGEGECMNRRDARGMPPIGSSVVDSSGGTLLSDWINSLGGC